MERCQNAVLGDGEALGDETLGLPDGLGERLGEAVGLGSFDGFPDGLGFGVVETVGEHIGSGLGLVVALTRSRVIGNRISWDRPSVRLAVIVTVDW